MLLREISLRKIKQIMLSGLPNYQSAEAFDVITNKNVSKR